jgi:hypothetical protein
MKVHRIILDGDGVLADMVTAAIKWLGSWNDAKIQRFYARYPRGDYNMAGAFGLTKEVCWSQLDTPRFWATVEPYAGAQEFVNQVLRVANKRYVSVAIATQATWNPLTLGTKAQGLAVFGLPTYVIWNGKKDFLDDGRTLLVDDCADNCDKWTGPVVEFPQVWNRRHKEVKDPLKPVYDVVLHEIIKELER